MDLIGKASSFQTTGKAPGWGGERGEKSQDWESLSSSLLAAGEQGLRKTSEDKPPRRKDRLIRKRTKRGEKVGIFCFKSLTLKSQIRKLLRKE